MLVSAALLLAGGCHKGAPERNGRDTSEPLRVAAASDLARAFEEVGAAFERQGGGRVDVSFGSTGLLAKQIAEGAPFDVFAAASTSFVDDVIRAGACLEGTRARYATGRIALWARDGAALPKGMAELSGARFERLAIANPEHAPYGRAAREALTNAGVWSAVEPRAVYGDNVQHALMFARSGNAELAIVARSLALSAGGSSLPIDPSLHAPIEQELVVCKGKRRGDALDRARAFASFVRGGEGQKILHRHGFALPEDATAR